jgi:SAM-dependent methyltransferase
MINNAENKDAVSFDDYTESYKSEVDSSIGFIGQEVDFFVELKARHLLKLAKSYFGRLDNIKVLDIGCGIGMVDKYLKTELSELYGVDIEPGVIERAKQNNPEINYELYDGIRLPFENENFDICFAVNVMHHVPTSQWENFLIEAKRVLKKNGIIAIYEHNPFNPLTRIAVSRCEFDREAVLLSSRKIYNLFKKAGIDFFKKGYIIFFPFSAEVFRKTEKFFSWLPLGAQHFICGIKKH